MDHHKVKAVLNTACIIMCGISKFPQIKTNLQAKSVEGLSIAALFIDVLRYKKISLIHKLFLSPIFSNGTVDVRLETKFQLLFYI